LVGRVVPVGGALNEKFLFDVTVTCKIVVRAEEDIVMRRISRRDGLGNRTRYYRIGYRGARGRHEKCGMDGQQGADEQTEMGTESKNGEHV
jgi:hypothetical protein